jgi:chromosome segregation ATPase
MEDTSLAPGNMQVQVFQPPVVVATDTTLQPPISTDDIETMKIDVIEDLESVTSSQRNEFDQILNEVKEKNKHIKSLENQKVQSEETIKSLLAEIEKQSVTIKELTTKLEEKDEQLQLKDTELNKKIADEQRLKEKFRNIARKHAENSDSNDDDDQSSKESSSRKRRKTSVTCKIDISQQNAANVAQNEELKRTVADLQFQLKRAQAANKTDTDAQPPNENCSCSEDLKKHKKFLSQLTKNYNTARDCVMHYKTKSEQLQNDLDNADAYWSAMVTKMTKLCKCKKTPIVPKRS